MSSTPDDSDPLRDADELSGDPDRAALRSALRGVRPLAVDTVELRPPAPPPVPAQSRRDELSVLSELTLLDPGEVELETGEELLFKRAGVQPAVIRKLRRGQIVVQDQLDLHGLTAAEAKLALVDFLQGCRLRGVRCVRIVHGKGHRSPGRLPVLKPKLAHWLAQRDEVMAYVSARPVDGGTGAVYVLLKLAR